MDFSRFTPQSFEQLIQALAAKILGPRIVVFGAGPDGGREATFEGRLPEAAKLDWDGYLVIQAKCREGPPDSGKDASWLSGHLNAELKKFSENENLRRPDYYLLCTNVHLSGVNKFGGKDRINQIFRNFQSDIGFRDWAICSADELRTFLDDAEGIRRRYAAWLTPNEVLTDLVERLSRPNLTRLLPRSLARDIRHERDVRLRESGQDT